MISVVVPLYNKESSVCQTLQTVLNQSYQDFEIVIVNDGSTDRSVEEAEKVKDSRIRIIHQSNAGVSAARNKGIEEAKGEYIAFLDADDEWEPDYLQTQYDLTRKYPDCGVFACNYEFHDQDGNITPTHLHGLHIHEENGILDNYFEVALGSHPPLWTSAVVVRKSSIQHIGGFLVGATLGEDLITWAKLALHDRIAFSKKVVAIYNFRSQKQLVVPRRAPDKVDLVGAEFDKLASQFDNVFLSRYVALWHKMRMVTFVRLGMTQDANAEYCSICKYTQPDKKVLFWKFMNLFPLSIRRFLLYQIAKFRQ